MNGLTVAVIEGDDAAPEAMQPSVRLIAGLVPEIDWVYPLVGAQAQEKLGSSFPPESRAIIDGARTTFFGATNGTAAAALKYLRWGKCTYANARPFRYFTGARSVLAQSEGIDFVMIRENLEDMYVCCEGNTVDLAPLKQLSPTFDKLVDEMGEGRYALKVITREGSERVIRYAFELARKRRKRLAATAKYNMLPKTDGFFIEIAREIAKEYPDVEFETFLVDDFACRMLTQPYHFDVVVIPNLYGDILSDSAAGMVGGLGMGPSGVYGKDYAYFEPSHGTAPDIVGRHIINPTATLLAGAMMLNYLDLTAQSTRLINAIAATYREGKNLTPDQGGTASTEDFCAAVGRHL